MRASFWGHSRGPPDDLTRALAQRDDLLLRLHAEIEARVRAEAALAHAKKIESVGQLTGGIAHDFNNLLQAVSGNLELISMAPDNRQKVERWAGNAREALELGTQLTGQLMTFSRQQRQDMQSIDVAAVIEGMRDTVRQSVGKTVELQIETDGDLCPISADPRQLELAVLNLAMNARHAMPQGGRLTVSARARALGEETGVAIEVTDTGTGMSEEVLERALEPFFTTKEPGHGSGLGLSLAYGAARQAGGELKVASREGEGTTVTMLIPCGRASQPAPPRKLARGS